MHAIDLSVAFWKKPKVFVFQRTKLEHTNDRPRESGFYGVVVFMDHFNVLFYLENKLNLLHCYSHSILQMFDEEYLSFCFCFDFFLAHEWLALFVINHIYFRKLNARFEILKKRTNNQERMNMDLKETETQIWLLDSFSSHHVFLSTDSDFYA